MKKYIVETLAYNHKLTFDTKDIANRSQQEIQEKLDEYVKKGYKLCSTNATKTETMMYIYLYFEMEM